MTIHDFVATDAFQHRLLDVAKGQISEMKHSAYDPSEGRQEVQAGDFIEDGPFSVTVSDNDGATYWGSFAGTGTCHGNWINSGKDSEDMPFECDGPVTGTWKARFPDGLDGEEANILSQMVDFEVEVEKAPTREDDPDAPLPPEFDNQL